MQKIKRYSNHKIKNNDRETENQMNRGIRDSSISGNKEKKSIFIKIHYFHIYLLIINRFLTESIACKFDKINNRSRMQ